MITNQIILTVIAALASMGVGALAASLKKRSKKDEASIKILKMIARKEIMDAYEKFIVNKEPMTLEEFDYLTDVFNAYSDLDGNGTAEKMYEAFLSVKPWIAND